VIEKTADEAAAIERKSVCIALKVPTTSPEAFDASHKDVREALGKQAAAWSATCHPE
jgi:hypothetical protein